MLKKIIAVVLSGTIATTVLSQTISQKLDELVQAYAKLDKFSGTVLVAQRGNILLEKGYGYQNIQAKTANDTNTIYEIASITKQFTSALILKLEELHKLSVKDKLTKYYPGFPKGDSITIENLLTHTSGIFNYTQDSHFTPSDEKAMLIFLAAKPFDFSPGTGWSYDNSGYYLLGLIIQKVTGLSYREAMQKYVFKPLQMTNSGMDFKELVSAQKAIGYYADTTEAPTKIAPLANYTEPFAAGAIFSTVGDLYKWHRGLQTYKIIGKASLEKAYTPFKNNYGYGWIIDSIAVRRRVSHSGGIPGFRSNIARIPEDDVCVILLGNTEEMARDILTKKIFAILYNQSYTLPGNKIAIQLSEDILKKYVGTYEVKEQGLVIDITSENGHLMAQPVHGPRGTLFALDETHFFIAEDDDFTVIFGTDETGKVDKITIQQSDQTRTALRIK